MVKVTRVGIAAYIVALLTMLTPLLGPVAMGFIFLAVWVIGIPYWVGYFSVTAKDEGWDHIAAALWPMVLVIYAFVKVVLWISSKGRKMANHG